MSLHCIRLPGTEFGGRGPVSGSGATTEREARCGCGVFRVTVSGEPLEICACSCLNCQRESGGAFTYEALYPKSGVSAVGERTTWRRHVDSGRWLETDFCPVCGVAVCTRMEAFPEMVSVSVGCFADPDFPLPERLYWASRCHRWLKFPEGTELVETQTR